jgi:hypothetical protein
MIPIAVRSMGESMVCDIVRVPLSLSSSSTLTLERKAHGAAAVLAIQKLDTPLSAAP